MNNDLKQTKKLEKTFLTKVIKELDKDKFTKDNLENIDKAFIEFTRKAELDELALLRNGEVMIRNTYGDVIDNLNNLENVKAIIFSILDKGLDSDELYVPELVVLIGAVVRMSIYKIENKEINFDDYKKENE